MSNNLCFVSPSIQSQSVMLMIRVGDGGMWSLCSARIDVEAFVRVALTGRGNRWMVTGGVEVGSPIGG